MALRDQPYLPLYVQDFLSDEKLIECSAAANGIYIRLMCIMHKAEQYGKICYNKTPNKILTGTINAAQKLVRFLPFSYEEIFAGIEELLEQKVIYDDGFSLCQKRMIADNDISLKRSNSGKKGMKKRYQKSKKICYNKTPNETLTNTESEYEYENIYINTLKKGGAGGKNKNSPNVENHCTEGDKKTENGKSEKSSQEFAAENEDANRGDLSHEKNQGGQIITEDRESAADAKKTSKTGLCTPNINPQKTENGKSEKSSQEFAAAEVLDELSFENVWAMYERKGNRKSSQRRWDGLPKKAKLLAVAHIPRYVAATPEIQYRKNFETYIGQEAWNDEIITKNGTDSRFTSTENGYSGNGANTFRTDAERRRNERQMLAQVATAVLQQPETQKD
jgi:hypothetical protein